MREIIDNIWNAPAEKIIEPVSQVVLTYAIGYIVATLIMIGVVIWYWKKDMNERDF